MSKNFTQDGIGGSVELSDGGPRLKENTTAIEARTNDDTAFVQGRGADPLAADDWVTLRHFDASAASPLEAGLILDSLAFFVDSANKNSYPGTGTAVSDLLGNATGGTLAGASYSEGAFQFDGVSGDLTFTKPAGLDDIFAGGGTAIVFCRPFDAGEVNDGMIMETGTSTGWRIVTDTIDEESVRLSFRVNFSGTDGSWQTFRQAADADPTPTNLTTGTLPFPVPLGAYTAIAIVYDSDNVANVPEFYFNGTRWTTTLGIDTTTTPTGALSSDAGNPIIIGNRAADDRTFKGDFEIGMLFSKALSQNEIRQVTSLFAPRFGLGVMGQNANSLLATDDVRGQNILLSAGDGKDEGQGGCVTILGGDTDKDSPSFNRGGDILIRAGGQGNSLGGDPGLVTVTGGYGDGAGVLTLSGGDIAGNATNLGATDTIVIHGSDAVDAPASPSSGSTGGSVLMRGGYSGFSRVCGAVTVRGGEALDSPVGATYGTVEGGDVTVRGGNGLGLRPGGTLTLKSGDAGTTNVTGGVILATGVNTSTGGGVTAPDIDIICSPCQVAGAGSAVKIQAGDNLASSNGDGGVVTLTAGASADGDGGSITITAGDSASADAADPAGSIVLTAGSQTSGVGNSDGGGVRLTTGTSASGNAGNIDLDGPVNANAEGLKFGVATVSGVSGTITFATLFAAAPVSANLTVEDGGTGSGSTTIISLANSGLSTTGINWVSSVVLSNDIIHWQVFR
jgi:hypothetical protein